MGQAKQQLMDKAANDELIDFLKLLLDREELSGALNGIAKQVVTKGAESMTDTQRSVVEGYLESYKSKHECEVCSNDNVSSLTDYIEIADEGVCPTCQYVKEKYMNE
ncbi:hypothetical protein [Hymenobacter sp.]|uniref:hypothetical protein n=1 Tax=Hymenobacter sp. TaxID=1898978 RepID=UPI00286B5929|nr:hypothetical protein [Hymenobacter sp.]